MGQVVVPTRGPVYVDANSVISFVEHIEPSLTASRPLWDALNAGAVEVISSDLTLMEVLVKPFRDGNLYLQHLYRNILGGAAGVRTEPILPSVLERAALVRASHGLKTPDAIHAATALQTGCVMFLTNDAGFRRVPGLNVVLLSEVAAS